jgi:hypothetical protein
VDRGRDAIRRWVEIVDQGRFERQARQKELIRLVEIGLKAKSGKMSRFRATESGGIGIPC